MNLIKKLANLYLFFMNFLDIQGFLTENEMYIKILNESDYSFNQVAIIFKKSSDKNLDYKILINDNIP